MYVWFIIYVNNYARSLGVFKNVVVIIIHKYATQIKTLITKWMFFFANFLIIPSVCLLLYISVLYLVSRGDYTGAY